MSKRLLFTVEAAVCALACLIPLLAAEQQSRAGGPSSGDSYRQILASKGQQPDTVRLEHLISLYLRDSAATDALPAARRQQAIATLEVARSIHGADLPRQAKLDWRVLLNVAAADADAALSASPGSTASYAALVRQLTGSDKTPDEIHEAGLAEVQRTLTAIDALARSTGFSGTAGRFVAAMRRDPRCSPLDEDAVRKQFQGLMKQVEARLPRLFRNIPRTPYEVVPTAAVSLGSPAYAVEGSLALDRPGRVHAQTPYANGCSFGYVMLHEALPGHLLQAHVASEFSVLSALRADSRSRLRWTAFREGWAHYAAGLGDELGLDLDAYARAERFGGQFFMAVRTVIETGIHAKGWTREQAVEYYKTTASWAPPQVVEAVVTVATADPGQFLSYLIGQQEITALRAYAEIELGSQFDIRLFHDEVLRDGPLPLAVLDTQIRDWVAAQKQGHVRASGM